MPRHGTWPAPAPPAPPRPPSPGPAAPARSPRRGGPPALSVRRSGRPRPVPQRQPMRPAAGTRPRHPPGRRPPDHWPVPAPASPPDLDPSAAIRLRVPPLFPGEARGRARPLQPPDRPPPPPQDRPLPAGRRRLCSGRPAQRGQRQPQPRRPRLGAATALCQ